MKVPHKEFRSGLSRIRGVGAELASVVVGVEAPAPTAYPRMTLAIASTLSGSVVRTLRGGEGWPV